MVISKNKYRIAIIIAGALLTVFGVYMVMEASSVWAQYKYNDSLFYFKKQAIFATLGIFGFILGSKIGPKTLKKYANIFLFISLLLLVLVVIPGVGLKRGGSSSWLGFSIFTFQPSEFFKLGIVIFMAKYLENNYYDTAKIKNIIPALILCMVGFTLIMFQPDFGTCMVIAIAIFAQLFSSRIPYKWFVILIFLGLLSIIFLIFSASYRFERITAFFDPFSDPLGSGFQIIQSLYAIGPGGLLGSGASNSIQKYYYLPEPQTDFIYAIVVEEFGFIGGIIVILLYSIIFYSSFQLISKSQSLFKGFVSLGLLTLFMVQVIINLGVVISLFPVTGITLPLLSYGGSSLVVILFSLGLLINKEEDKSENIAC